MRVRRLGALECPALGFGTLALTGGYGPVDSDAAIGAVHAALDLGVRLVDTADFYGGGEVERLLGAVLAGRRDDVLVGTRGGAVFSGPGRPTEFDGSPEFLRRACDASLLRLGVDHIDLYTLARVDPRVPVEESVGGLAELVRAGKVGHIGLSEVPADVIRRAHATHPLAAVQSEYSLWQRRVEADVLPTVVELGIGFVAHTPLGRGFLTGTIGGADDLAGTDFRRREERFSAEALEREQPRVAVLRRIAGELGVTPAQAALAWLLSRAPGLVPIPGSRSGTHLAENVAAVAVELDAARVEELSAAFTSEPVPA